MGFSSITIPPPNPDTADAYSDQNNILIPSSLGLDHLTVDFQNNVVKVTSVFAFGVIGLNEVILTDEIIQEAPTNGTSYLAYDQSAVRFYWVPTGTSYYYNSPTNSFEINSLVRLFPHYVTYSSSVLSTFGIDILNRWEGVHTL